MSVRVSEQVWKTSRQHGNPLLVLLALADFANDEGVAFPSVGTLAKKARLGERAVHRIVSALVTSEELQIVRSPGRVNVYRIVINGVNGETPLHRRSPLNGRAPTDAPPATPVLNDGPPKPSSNPSLNRQSSGPPPDSTAETLCPTGPHTFVGSYSEHLKNDPRHKVKRRD